MEDQSNKKKCINTSHAWKGVWNRPMKIDEDSLSPFTVARMTDHNVRGSDRDDTGDLADDQMTKEEMESKSDIEKSRERKKAA